MSRSPAAAFLPCTSSPSPAAPRTAMRRLVRSRSRSRAISRCGSKTPSRADHPWFSAIGVRSGADRPDPRLRNDGPGIVRGDKRRPGADRKPSACRPDQARRHCRPVHGISGCRLAGRQQHTALGFDLLGRRSHVRNGEAPRPMAGRSPLSTRTSAVSPSVSSTVPAAAAGPRRTRTRSCKRPSPSGDRSPAA